MTDTTTIHARLTAVITARLEAARAAGAARPGEWRAVSTHDGLEYDGYSRVLAEETTATGLICRGVAHQIVDSLTLVRLCLTCDPPTPAAVSVHIALHDPPDAIRRYERDLKIVERHRPMAGDHRWCRWCTDSIEVPSPCDVINMAADVYPEARS